MHTTQQIEQNSQNVYGDNEQRNEHVSIHTFFGELQNLAPRLYKFFMLNSAEHKNLNTHKYKSIQKFQHFQV